jgi:hypothetical protein
MPNFITSGTFHSGAYPIRDSKEFCPSFRLFQNFLFSNYTFTIFLNLKRNLLQSFDWGIS